MQTKNFFYANLKLYKFKNLVYNIRMNTLTLPNNKTISVETGSQIEDILDLLEIPLENLVAVKINNEICSLTQKIDVNAKIEPVYLNSTQGSAIYRRSLCLLLATAAHKIFPGKRLLVGHSLGYGYYYTIDSENSLTEDDIQKLKNQMMEIVDKNVEITQSYVSYQEATELLEKLGLVETRKQLNYICKSKILMNNLEDFSDIYFGPLVVKTGVLKVFDLVKYQDGFLLRFPSSRKTDTLTEFEDVPQLFDVYKRYKEWGKRIGVTSVASLNKIVNDRKTKDFINITETYKQSKLQILLIKSMQKEL